MVSCVFVVAAVMSCLASPALAANRTVNAEDNQFVLPRVGVKPGESVTWTNTGNGAHNVAFDDGSFISPSPPSLGPWTTSRTFDSAGSYRYYCQVHGGPGGQAMSGIVDVNLAGNGAPLAQFSASTTLAQIGQLISFDASSSADFDGTVAQYEWDLDGNGSFETSTGSTPTTSRSYPTGGTIVVKLRVTDNGGAASEAIKSLLVNAPPTASFTVTPNPGLTGGKVVFNGSGSVDSEGPLTRYEWDLDGNGSYETDTDATPTASHTYTTPGPITVRLRVTDGAGATASTTRSLQINQRPAPAPILAGVLPTTNPPAPPSFASSKRTIAVSRSGAFTYSFRAGKGLSGTIDLRSVSKVRVSARQRISLGRKRFTVPSTGTVTVRWKLSRKKLTILKQAARIKFRVAVNLQTKTGATSSGATALTLKRRR
jgi:plastocyanin